jgi:hypothetical protein
LTLDDLEPLPERTRALYFPGVYVILPRKPDSVKCLYVGQSADVFQRLTTHRRTRKWFTEDCEVRAIRLESLESRLLAETGLILRLRPTENRAIKIGLTKAGRLFEIQFIRGKK